MLFHYRTRFDFAAMASSNWSIEKEKKSYKVAFEEDPSYVSWCRKHLTKDSSKGPALDWSRYIKARDLVDCKAANVPFYAGTTLRREFCD